MSISISKSKSYVILVGVEGEGRALVEKTGQTLNYSVISLKEDAAFAEILFQVTHSLGVFVKSDDEKTIRSAVVAAEACRTSLHVFSTVPQPWFKETPERRLHVNGKIDQAFLTKYFDELMQPKLKELCQFSVQYVSPHVLPDVNLEWAVAKSPIAETDMLIYCETIAKHFLGCVTIRSNYKRLRARSQVLSGASDQDILDFFAEFGNQLLGIVNFNLRKLNIDARVGLPTAVKKDGTAAFKWRSSFCLPSYTLSDTKGDISVSYQFLFPVLRVADFKSDFNFEVAAGNEEEVLELF